MYKLPENFTVTAHTGCEGTKDNSLESIKAGQKAGADIVEFDLRFDKEGNGILSHDETAEKAVSLDEAFELVASYDKLKVNVDCKTTDNLTDVYRLSEKYGITDRIFYTGIEEKDVPAARAQTPMISYFLNYPAKSLKKRNEKYIRFLISLTKENGAVGINLKYTRCSKKMVKMFHDEGLLVSVWTANSPRVMKKCLSFAPDNITTRYPVTLKQIIE